MGKAPSEKLVGGLLKKFEQRYLRAFPNVMAQLKIMAFSKCHYCIFNDVWTKCHNDYGSRKTSLIFKNFNDI